MQFFAFRAPWPYLNTGLNVPATGVRRQSTSALLVTSRPRWRASPRRLLRAHSSLSPEQPAQVFPQVARIALFPTIPEKMQPVVLEARIQIRSPLVEVEKPSELTPALQQAANLRLQSRQGAARAEHVGHTAWHRRPGKMHGKSLLCAQIAQLGQCGCIDHSQGQVTLIRADLVLTHAIAVGRMHYRRF